MDFLDPRKQRAHMIRLIAGYILIGLAILIATLILLYQAYGFGLGKDGEVIQNGLVFMSSQPSSARIYLDGKLYKSNTDTRMQLPAGQYKAELQRDGYRSWQRLLSVEGGSVQHFDYPLLVATKITSTAVKAYPTAPGFASASPDRRWLVVQQDASPLTYDLFDVADPKKVSTAATVLTLPETILTAPRSGQQTIKLVEWSTDNRHIMVQHIYPGGSEYISIDRQDPTQSLNLTKTLALDATKELTLRDKKFDKFYVYDTAARTLGTTTVSDAGKVTPLLEQVLAFKPYGGNIVLYITDKDPLTGKPVAAGKVLSVLRDGDATYKIREHGAGGPFLIDLAQYSSDWYIAAGASADNKVYVYKNPQSFRKSAPAAPLVPVQILKVAAPNRLAFSSNTEFVMSENATSFADYDAETEKGYNFVSKLPIDAPAAYATWMDGHRLTYVSGGKLVMFDYDNINPQSLVDASPNYLPFFNRNYAYVYTLAPTPGTTTGGMTLSSSSLLAPADQ